MYPLQTDLAPYHLSLQMLLGVEFARLASSMREPELRHLAEWMRAIEIEDNQ